MAADAQNNFLAGKQCKSTEYVGAFATTMCTHDIRCNELGVGRYTNQKPTHTSQHFSIQSFARSAVVWPEFQCQTMPSHPHPPIRPTVWGIRVDLAG